jgi:cation diffusion facilitator family transporter
MAAPAHDLSAAAHSHAFADAGRAARQRALGLVVLLTLVTMVVELAAGWWTGSLALLADGWHMGTHAFALGGAWLAYWLSARAGARSDGGYAFGGWKIEVLAAYTSGLALLAVALLLVVDGVRRLVDPQPVDWAAAMAVAVLGLAVNLASAWLMLRGDRAARGAGDDHHDGDHHHAHPDQHHHHHHHHHHDHPRAAPARGRDHNFHAAYLHVLADALTSVLAIAALAGGLWFGWSWLDPAVALFGAVVIARWSFGVLGGSARALVDATQDPALFERIRSAIESDGDARVADLHVWQVGGAAWCGALAVVADSPLPAAAYRARLAGITSLRHVTVEVHRCPGCG